MGVEQEGEKVLTDYTFLTFAGGVLKQAGLLLCHSEPSEAGMP